MPVVSVCSSVRRSTSSGDLCWAGIDGEDCGDIIVGEAVNGTVGETVGLPAVFVFVAVVLVFVNESSVGVLESEKRGARDDTNAPMLAPHAEKLGRWDCI